MIFFFIHLFIHLSSKVFPIAVTSYLNIRVGHVGVLPLTWVPGRSFRRRCTFYYFFLDLFGFLFESMALHGNWTERLAEQKTSDGELYASMIFEWMPATFSTGSFESLSLFSKFLVINWMIFGGLQEKRVFFSVCLFTFCVPLSKKDKWGWNYWENSDCTTNFSDFLYLHHRDPWQLSDQIIVDVL